MVHMASVLIWPCHNHLPSRLSFSSKAISWPLTLLWYISHVIISFWPPWTDWVQSSKAFLAIHKIHTYISIPSTAEKGASNASNWPCHWFSWFYNLWEMLCVSVIINDHVVDKQSLSYVMISLRNWCHCH